MKKKYKPLSYFLIVLFSIAIIVSAVFVIRQEIIPGANTITGCIGYWCDKTVNWNVGGPQDPMSNVFLDYTGRMERDPSSGIVNWEIYKSGRLLNSKSGEAMPPANTVLYEDEDINIYAGGTGPSIWFNFKDTEKYFTQSILVGSYFEGDNMNEISYVINHNYPGWNEMDVRLKIQLIPRRVVVDLKPQMDMKTITNNEIPYCQVTGPVVNGGQCVLMTTTGGFTAGGFWTSQYGGTFDIAELRDVKVRQGENKFEFFLNRNMPVGDYDIVISTSLPQTNPNTFVTKGSITREITRGFGIATKKMTLEIPKGSGVPTGYKFQEGTIVDASGNCEKLNSESSLPYCIAIRNDLTGGCFDYGVPVTRDRVYVCDSLGLITEVVYQPLSCKSDVDCGLGKTCEIGTGVCFESRLFTEIMQCETASDCFNPGVGIVVYCLSINDTKKCAYEGELVPIIDRQLVDCNSKGCNNLESCKDGTCTCDVDSGNCLKTVTNTVEVEKIVERIVEKQSQTVSNQQETIESTQETIEEKENVAKDYTWLWVTLAIVFVLIFVVIMYLIVKKKRKR